MIPRHEDATVIRYYSFRADFKLWPGEPFERVVRGQLCSMRWDRKGVPAESTLRRFLQTNARLARVRQRVLRIERLTDEPEGEP